MYLGKIVEISHWETLFNNPLHPYTVALMSAIPIPNPRLKRQRVILEGDVPSPLNPPSGCAFHPRCPNAMSICSKHLPNLREVGPDRSVRCWLYQDHPEKDEETIKVS